MPASKTDKYHTCGGDCAKAYRDQLTAYRLRNCATCGKEFKPRANQLSGGFGLFCSQKCNTNGRAAMNSPEAQRKSKASWKAAYEAGRIKVLKGPESPSWKGGKERERARVRAYIDSGRSAELRRASYHREKDKHKEWSQRRKSLKLDRLPRGTIKRIGEMQRWCCAICRKNVADRYHVDHITPLAKGGKHEPKNLQILCGPCNVRKSAKDPIKYMQERGFLL